MLSGMACIAGVASLRSASPASRHKRQPGPGQARSYGGKQGWQETRVWKILRLALALS